VRVHALRIHHDADHMTGPADGLHIAGSCHMLELDLRRPRHLLNLVPRRSRVGTPQGQGDDRHVPRPQLGNRAVHRRRWIADQIGRIEQTE
jgi:hypothetical protein